MSLEERSSFRTHFVVGLFTLAIGAGIVAVLAFLATKEASLERTYRLHVRFTDVSGLKIGAPVQLQGAPVGRVTSISLAEPMPPRFPRSEWGVDLAMRAEDRALRSRITTASIFSIQSEGVFGNKYINVTFGDAGQELPPDADIAGAVAAGIDAQTFEKLSVALDSLSGAASDLRGLLAGDVEAPGSVAATGTARPSLRSVVTNLTTTLENAAAASVVLRDALSPGNQAQIRQTFDDLSKSAKNLADVTERTKQGMDAWADTLEKMKFWKGWFGGRAK